MLDGIVLKVRDNRGPRPKMEKTMFKCICQECGEEFECEEPDGKLCNDCLEDAEYEDSEYEE